MDTYRNANETFVTKYTETGDCKLAFVAAEQNATLSGSDAEEAKNFALLVGLQNTACTTDDMHLMMVAFSVAKMLNIQAGDHGVVGETLLDPLDA